MTAFRLRDADVTLKLLITAFLLALTTGYAVGLLFVEHTTSLTATGVQEEFLGNNAADSAPEIKYAKASSEMFVFMHNHMLSLSFMFFAVGMIFYFSSVVSSKVKSILLIEPFAAIVTTFGSIALVRFVSPAFNWLVIVSGVSLFTCYVVVVALIMKELWFS